MQIKRATIFNRINWFIAAHLQPYKAVSKGNQLPILYNRTFAHIISDGTIIISPQYGQWTLNWFSFFHKGSTSIFCCYHNSSIWFHPLVLFLVPLAPTLVSLMPVLVPSVPVLVSLVPAPMTIVSDFFLMFWVLFTVFPKSTTLNPFSNSSIMGLLWACYSARGSHSRVCQGKDNIFWQIISICNSFLAISLLFSVFQPRPFPSESSGHENLSHSVDSGLLGLLLYLFSLYIELSFYDF